MKEQQQQLQGQQDEEIIICIGRDPRENGVVLEDSFARGASGIKGVKVFNTVIATSSALFEFCRYVFHNHMRLRFVAITTTLALPVIEFSPFNS